MSPAERRRSLAAVIACVSVFALTLGMTYPLLSLILERAGVSTTMIGLNGAMTSVGILVSAPLIPRLVERTGVAPFMFGCIAVTGTILVLLRAIPDLYVWFALRLVLGAAISGLFVLSETWLNQVADDRTRGRLVGLYATVLSLCFAAGPLLIPVFGSEGWTPFVIGTAFVALAALPLLWARRLAPALGGGAAGGLIPFFRLAPTLLAAVAVVGFTDSAILSLLPIYGLRNGYGESGGALMLAVLILGNVALQVPVGWLADRLDRYLVLTLCAAAGVAGGVLLPLVVGLPLLMWPALFLWGGFLFGIYTVALTLVGERFKGAQLVTANAAFALMWGAGGIAGPATGGWAMDLVGPHGLPASIAVACALFLALAAVRHPGALGLGGRPKGA